MSTFKRQHPPQQWPDDCEPMPLAEAVAFWCLVSIVGCGTWALIAWVLA